MDRIVRIWNPYVAGKPTGMLRGHNAPIFYLYIADEENRIFSISTDKCIKVRRVRHTRVVLKPMHDDTWLQQQPCTILHRR